GPDNAGIVNEIKAFETPVARKHHGVDVQQKVSKGKYTAAVEAIKEHIRQGNVYEMNYCMEFFAECVKLEPLSLYLALAEVSPTPFSGYLKFNGNFLLCASPERFLKKEGAKMISQPIKGTI